MKEITTIIAKEITDILKEIDDNSLVDLHNIIARKNRIFIAGTGRSGLIGKAFGMRLMHSGYSVYIVGETITPSINEDDLLLIISGSGNTATLNLYAEKANEINASIALITTNKTSKIARLSEIVLVIPAATKNRLAHEPNTIQPLGNQFDQSAHLLLDAICISLAELNEGSGKMINKHANLE